MGNRKDVKNEKHRHKAMTVSLHRPPLKYIHTETYTCIQWICFYSENQHPTHNQSMSLSNCSVLPTLFFFFHIFLTAGTCTYCVLTYNMHLCCCIFDCPLLSPRASEQTTLDHMEEHYGDTVAQMDTVCPYSQRCTANRLDDSTHYQQSLQQEKTAEAKTEQMEQNWHRYIQFKSRIMVGFILRLNDICNERQGFVPVYICSRLYIYLHLRKDVQNMLN